MLGIHHDEIKFVYDGVNLKEYGSEGQQKNAIIAYKLSVIDLFKEKKGSYPILLLDDLFSELDKNKINNILKMIKKRLQVFITVTELDSLSVVINKNYKVFQIKKGTVEVIKNET